jgi:hypothetical protein
MLYVPLDNGEVYTIRELLAGGDSNTKLRKSNAASKDYLTVGLSLAPANESGYEVCASRSAGCTQACLFRSGMGNMPSVIKARIVKTKAFFEQRSEFLAMLEAELAWWEAKAERSGKLLACRLNVVSDVIWEKIHPALFSEFTSIQFYDYTKHFLRMCKFAEGVHWPKNYHLTFSRSEANEHEVNDLLQSGRANVAVVFDSKNLPSTWKGYNVVSGDDTDLRFLDGSGVVVGLYAKGRGKKDESGFVVSLPLAK